MPLNLIELQCLKTKQNTIEKKLKKMKTNFNNLLEMVGNTPVVKVNNIDTGPCELYVKLENLNPGGSIKDRVGIKIIEEAEKSGALKSGGTIVECTAGNTGLGLALAAKLKGYDLILVIPDKMSQEKVMHLEAMGVEIVFTRSDVEKGHPEHYQEMAAAIVKKTPGSFLQINLAIQQILLFMKLQPDLKFGRKWMVMLMPLLLTKLESR